MIDRVQHQRIRVLAAAAAERAGDRRRNAAARPRRADSICIIMKPGKTSAMPVSASVPRRETNQVSISPVEAWASMTRTFGQASRSRVASDRRLEQQAGARVEARLVSSKGKRRSAGRPRGGLRLVGRPI